MSESWKRALEPQVIANVKPEELEDGAPHEHWTRRSGVGISYHDPYEELCERLNRLEELVMGHFNDDQSHIP